MAASTTSDVSDGPVLNFINKRLRALRKKLNRITQMEEGIAQGKPINKEQEETLRSKPSIAAAIDELEKLKQPLSVAVNEEVALAIERRETESKVEQTLDLDEKNEKKEQEAPQVEEVVLDEKNLFVQDLLNLIYFGSLFDVKSQNDFNSIMLTRAHERECCLAYDTVMDDDSTEMLGVNDLDLISAMGSLLTSRPGASSLSHQNALQRCIEHAKLWLEKSDQPIDVNSTVTYAGLREKLTKIMGSNYFTITPEMKAPDDVAAAADGNYASFQVPAQVDGSEQKEDEMVNYRGSETYDEQSGPAEELHKEEYDGENYVETSAQAAGSEKSHSEAGVEYRDPHQVPRRPYQNQRSGGGRGGGGGGGRRPYSNGGGGGGRSGGRRGGGGPHQNLRNQYYDQQGGGGGYYQKNYYNNRGRGGGRGNSYNPNAAPAGLNVGES